MDLQRRLEIEAAKEQERLRALEELEAVKRKAEAEEQAREALRHKKLEVCSFYIFSSQMG